MRCKVTVEINDKGETSIVGSTDCGEPMDLESILATLEVAYEGIAEWIKHEEAGTTDKQ